MNSALIEEAGLTVDGMKTWDDMKIIVCRTHLGGPDELPSVAQAMPAVSASAEISDIEKIRNAF